MPCETSVICPAIQLQKLILFFATITLYWPRALVASTYESRPNVVIVLTDEQGHGDLACNGNPIVKTPNIDELASQSIRLTDFRVAPMCTPAPVPPVRSNETALCGKDE